MPPLAPGLPLKAVKVLVRAQIRFLYHVLGILFVPSQPASEVIGGVEMRQDGRLEPCELLIFGGQRCILIRYGKARLRAPSKAHTGVGVILFQKNFGDESEE